MDKKRKCFEHLVRSQQLVHSQRPNTTTYRTYEQTHLRCQFFQQQAHKHTRQIKPTNVHPCHVVLLFSRSLHQASCFYHPLAWTTVYTNRWLCWTGEILPPTGRFRHRTLHSQASSGSAPPRVPWTWRIGENHFFGKRTATDPRYSRREGRVKSIFKKENSHRSNYSHRSTPRTDSRLPAHDLRSFREDVILICRI